MPERRTVRCGIYHSRWRAKGPRRPMHCRERLVVFTFDWMYILSLNGCDHMQRAQEREPDNYKPISGSPPKIKLCARPNKPKAGKCARRQRAGKRAEPPSSETIKYTCGDNGITDTMIHHVNNPAQIRPLHVVAVKEETIRRDGSAVRRQCCQETEPLWKCEMKNPQQHGKRARRVEKNRKRAHVRLPFLSETSSKAK